MVPVSSNNFLDIQENIECRFTLKLVRDKIATKVKWLRVRTPLLSISLDVIFHWMSLLFTLNRNFSADKYLANVSNRRVVHLT